MKNEGERLSFAIYVHRSLRAYLAKTFNVKDGDPAYKCMRSSVVFVVGGYL